MLLMNIYALEVVVQRLPVLAGRATTRSEFVCPKFSIFLDRVILNTSGIGLIKSINQTRLFTEADLLRKCGKCHAITIGSA